MSCFLNSFVTFDVFSSDYLCANDFIGSAPVIDIIYNF